MITDNEELLLNLHRGETLKIKKEEKIKKDEKEKPNALFGY